MLLVVCVRCYLVVASCLLCAHCCLYLVVACCLSIVVCYVLDVRVLFHMCCSCLVVVVCFSLCGVHRLLFVVCCLLLIVVACCLLFVNYCCLLFVDRVLVGVRGLLHVVCWLFGGVRCWLFVVCCVLCVEYYFLCVGR